MFHTMRNVGSKDPPGTLHFGRVARPCGWLVFFGVATPFLAAFLMRTKRNIVFQCSHWIPDSKAAIDWLPVKAATVGSKIRWLGHLVVVPRKKRGETKRKHMFVSLAEAITVLDREVVGAVPQDFDEKTEASQASPITNPCSRVWLLQGSRLELGPQQKITCLHA